MKIKKVVGREIFDSRGLPTIECEITLEDDFVALGSAASGISRGDYEAKELRDGGDRLLGLSVHKAIDVIERTIAPEILETEPNVVQSDLRLIELDGTEHKEKLGANTLLAVSYAVCRAQAHVAGVDLYEMIATLSEASTVSVPYPLFNLINGGLHADNGLSLQEILVMPVGAKSLRQGMDFTVTLFYMLKEVMEAHGQRLLVGDEGGFCPIVQDPREALDYLMEAIVALDAEDEFHIALDVAATTLYDAKSEKYQWGDKKYTADQMIDIYAKLLKNYPIYSIEDGLAFHDKEGWQRMTARLGEKIQIVGDDLFATDPERIAEGIELQLANAAIIKPNQIGTVTEAIQSIGLCQQYGMGTIVSHRSGETEDTFIADLSVGTSAGQFKSGGCSRGERLSKYNQLLRIEDRLVFTLLDE
ncbi:MAG: phosphopyruvate hydratase [Candidatus Babeliales bacterium]